MQNVIVNSQYSNTGLFLNDVLNHVNHRSINRIARGKILKTKNFTVFVDFTTA